jgi:hypothetical protein
VFEAMEQSRARAFLAALGGRMALLVSVAAPGDVAHVRRAAERSAAEFRRLEASIARDDLAEAKVAARRLSAARSDEEALLNGIERSPRLAAAVSPPVPDASAFARELAAGEVFVEIAVLPEGSVALVIDGGGPRPFDPPEPDGDGGPRDPRGDVRPGAGSDVRRSGPQRGIRPWEDQRPSGRPGVGDPGAGRAETLIRRWQPVAESLPAGGSLSATGCQLSTA